MKSSVWRAFGLAFAGLGALCLVGGTGKTALAQSYPLPFDPFLASESFGCKHLLIPGSEILPHAPVFDTRVPPGWKSVAMKKGGHNKVVETLIIKGSAIGHRKDKSGTVSPTPLIVIPAGGLVYDATPVETHLPVGERGVIFGHDAVLKTKDVKEETCRDFSVLAGRSFSVGDSVITYVAPGPKKGPLVLWRTFDGVSIRPQALSEYPAGQVPATTSTRIVGAYTHAGQIAEHASFSAPMLVREQWRLDGREKTVKPNMEWFPHFRMIPISCPIGHHIGLMVYNDVPIVIEEGKKLSLYGGYLKLKVIKVQSSGTTVFSVNGRSYTGQGGVDAVLGQGRVVDGIRNTLKQAKSLAGGV